MAAQDLVEQMLDLAFRFHQAQDLARAEELYRRVLAADPRHAAAWHLLGAVAFQRKDHPQAIACMRRSIELRPDEPSYASNLGLALTAAGRWEEAATALRRALQLRPDDADAWMKLGNVEKARKDLAAAEASYRRALALDPRMPSALSNLGALLVQKGDVAAAVAALESSLALAPDVPESHYNWALARQMQRRSREAEAGFRRAIQLRPAEVEFQLGLATLLFSDGRAREAQEVCRRAVALAPGSSRAHAHLGKAMAQLHDDAAAAVEFEETLRLEPDAADAHAGLCFVLTSLGRLQRAVAHGRRAVALAPQSAAAHDNLGAALVRCGDLAAAKACFQRTIELDPQHGLAHFHRAIVWLMEGDYAAGWREYEWRWSHPMAVQRPVEGPRWQGEPLAGKTLLLLDEQGFGDTLHFIRYASQLKRLGAAVWLRCSPHLKAILSSCRGVDLVIAEGEPLEGFDYYCPLLSAMGLLGVSPGHPPVEFPYLFAEPSLLAHWRARLAGLGALKVGLAWQGDPKHGWDRFRSLALAEFAPLAEVRGVRLISLQRGPGEEQLAAAGFPVYGFDPPLDNEAASFRDTAAVMRGLDLVISADTAIAHLAGGLAVPTWLLLNASADWRWGVTGQPAAQGESTAWYPTMRLFRQTRLGDWSTVFAQVAAELRRLVSQGTR